MNKIVYNACYGGFGLSQEAVLKYAELKGITLYPEQDRWTTLYWTHPEANSKDWHKWGKYYFDSSEFERHDSVLVKVVEELGSKRASGECAELRIYETQYSIYRIDEYDGLESVITKAEDEWVVIK